MSFFVVDPATGQRYGPADLPTLNVWISEGRVHAKTLIENAETRERCEATVLQGLQWQGPTPNLAAFREPPKMGPHATGKPSEIPGQQDATNAWIYFALGFAVCSVIFLPMSVIAANKAAAQGNPSARLAKILSIILIVINVLAIVVGLAMIGALMNNAAS